MPRALNQNLRFHWLGIASFLCMTFVITNHAHACFGGLGYGKVIAPKDQARLKLDQARWTELYYQQIDGCTFEAQPLSTGITKRCSELSSEDMKQYPYSDEKNRYRFSPEKRLKIQKEMESLYRKWREYQ